MEPDDSVIFQELELIADGAGLALIPCNLSRPAVSMSPAGMPILFLPRSASEQEQRAMVDERITHIQRKAGAA